MSRCPPQCCSGCKDEIHQKRLEKKAWNWRKEVCSAGPTPEINHKSYTDKDHSNDCEPPLIEDGDQLFATSLSPPKSVDIRASSTISQPLAEAFKTNSAMFAPPIPDYLGEFTSVFSKDSFDTLPESREWDHAIKITPGSKTSNCKVYPMSPAEQKELDVFLKENLEKGCIRPSKSLMASPVFFIKKKDGSL
jgi:hypothetical protein